MALFNANLLALNFLINYFIPVTIFCVECITFINLRLLLSYGLLHACSEHFCVSLFSIHQLLFEA